MSEILANTYLLCVVKSLGIGLCLVTLLSIDWSFQEKIKLTNIIELR